ncbi:MAG TPA: CPBP family intramembrane glutamic endopeptidase, partial [Nitrospirales bacterium]|nr:CPBP family intramembrane glutamic endopeptidase [Nitrospirales bacterium]
AVVAVALVEFVVFAPLFEELTFRGLVYGTLRRRFGVGAAALISAVIFAAVHGYGILGFASVLSSGLLWAWIYEQTGSLWPNILAHALNNLLVCVTVMWLLR